MNLARASDAEARKFGSLYFAGLLQTHTKSGRSLDSNVLPEESEIKDVFAVYSSLYRFAW